MPINTDRLYPIPEALPLLGLRTTKFYAELKANRIGAVKVGVRTFVPGREILRYREGLQTIGRSFGEVGQDAACQTVSGEARDE